MKKQYGLIIVNMLTLSRIPLALLFYYSINDLELKIANYIYPVLILGIIELTDLFDGILARKMSVTTEYGATLDPYADSISRLIVYITLSANGLCIFILPIVMAFRDITVAYSRIIIASKGKSVSAKWSGKTKAIFQAIGAFALLFGPLYWNFTGSIIMTILSWIILIVTALSAYEYVESAIIKILKNSNRGV